MVQTISSSSAFTAGTQSIHSGSTAHAIQQQSCGSHSAGILTGLKYFCSTNIFSKVINRLPKRAQHVIRLGSRRLPGSIRAFLRSIVQPSRLSVRDVEIFRKGMTAAVSGIDKRKFLSADSLHRLKITSYSTC